MNLLFSIDGKSVPLLFTCVHSIIKNGGYKNYSAFVLHSDLSEQSIFEIQRYFETIEWHFIHVPAEMFKGFPTVKRYPEQIYYRLAAPVLLPKEIDKVLYLDVDTIVINPLNELVEQGFEENLYIACTNTKYALTKFNQLRLGIPVEKDVPYVNTGVLLMNLRELRKCFRLNDLREFMEKKKELLWLPDQDILTALYGEKVKIIDQIRFNLSDRTLALYNIKNLDHMIDLDWVSNNVIIIHYFGKNKPWKEDYKGVLGQFYYEIINELSENMNEYKKRRKDDEEN